MEPDHTPSDGLRRFTTAPWRTSFLVQVVVLLMSANAPFAAFSTRGSSGWLGWKDLAAAVALAICVALVASDFNGFLAMARTHWPFTVLCVWFVMTGFWSILPSASASWIASRFPYFAAFIVICGISTLERRLAVVHASVLAAYVAGWLGSLRYPSFDRFGNEYSGSYIHNNVAAHAAVLGVVSGAMYLLLRPRRALLVLPGIAFCLWAGEASQSNSPRSVLAVATVVAFGVGATGLLIRRLTQQGRSTRFIGSTFAVLALLGVVGARVMVAVVFRNSEGVVDLTLTRRTGIWKACLALVRRAPVTGYGVGPTVFSTALRDEIEFRTGYVAVHAHNGFIDAALMAGVPAFALVATTVLQALRRIGQAIVNVPAVAAARACVLATVIALNMTEQDLFQGLLPTLFLLLAVASPTRPNRVTDVTA